MSVVLHFSGPSFNKSVVLQPGAAPLDVGRDAQAGVHLPDNDRLISRRHVSVEWASGGVRVTVLSKVNGITTSRGELGGGQSAVLATGDTAQLGRYSFQVGSAVAAPVAPAAPAALQDDPLQVFAAAPAAGGPSSVFDDPFFRAPQAPEAPAMDVPAALAAMSGQAAAGPSGFSGGAAAAFDPLAAFGGNQQPVHSSSSIDDFLGTPSSQPRGLGAAQLLRPESQEPARRLAIDHVHDFNLPLRPVQMQPSDDPLAALDAFAARPSPAAPQAAAAAPAPVIAPAPAPVAPPAPAPEAKPDDPWSAFASEWRPTQKKGDRKPDAMKPPTDHPINRAFDDAFSSSTAWRIDEAPEAEPSPDPLASASLQAEAIESAFALPELNAASGTDSTAALRALCSGLGISGPPQLAEEDWQRLGQAIRQIVQGLSDLMDVRAELKRELRATDRTMLGAQENNPLKSGMPLAELLHYLLFMPQGAAGYVPAQRALAEGIADLRAHEFASLAAVRAAVEGSIKEFEPDKLRTTLMKGRRSIATLVDNARLWDLYTSHYQHKGEHMADWLEQVFNRHFMPAYSREAERLRREAQPPVTERRN